MWEILFWVAFSTAALFGMICALWLLADAIGGSRLSAVVRVLDRQDRENLDLLLSQAKETFGGRREIVALISSALLPLSAQELALLQRYSAQMYEVAAERLPDVI